MSFFLVGYISASRVRCLKAANLPLNNIQIRENKQEQQDSQYTVIQTLVYLSSEPVENVHVLGTLAMTRTIICAHKSSMAHILIDSEIYVF